LFIGTSKPSKCFRGDDLRRCKQFGKRAIPTTRRVLPHATHAAFEEGARLTKALSRLKERHREMTALQVMAFTYIAAYPGSSARDLMKPLGTQTESTVSRALAILSDVGTKEIPNGLGLIELERGSDRRRYTLRLSKKGRDLMNSIANDLNRGRKKVHG
jgi:DNA-binding MarR family transcriptional regulator